MILPAEVGEERVHAEEVSAELKTPREGEVSRLRDVYAAVVQWDDKMAC